MSNFSYLLKSNFKGFLRGFVFWSTLILSVGLPFAPIVMTLFCEKVFYLYFVVPALPVSVVIWTIGDFILTKI